jgi:hypothetical protein
MDGLHRRLPSGFFRLLHLHAGNDKEGTTGELKDFRFNSAPDYEVLSYAWGKSKPEKPVKLEGDHSLGVEVFKALEDIRNVDEPAHPNSTGNQGNVKRYQLSAEANPDLFTAMRNLHIVKAPKQNPY